VTFAALRDAPGKRCNHLRGYEISAGFIRS